ncbi:MFS transporter [Bacillus sp. CMF21]|uniref:MFS transporter n=1 Tax=Metabacillus dongyingensis TaxID=2874282 RepID=UPI001FB3F1F4|nr:MFS transporter [Metabacillus dongyingensis]UAL52684.1 MFS transporter [Metabacillus dongyingensis]USK29000.1 MFS transporter [Bacillus sp. CMF21]
MKRVVKVSKRMTKVRYGVVFMLFITVIINYMDRSNIAVAAPFISKELELDPVQMGLIFSAFGWTYCALQIPGGWILDKLGNRKTHAIGIAGFSIATLLQGFVHGFSGFILLRVGLGAFEAPAFPTNSKVAASWFPEKERARAVAIYTSGQFIGLAFLTPALIFLQQWFGWRGLFIITGIIGISWAILWFLLYRDPQHSKKVNKQELDYIREGGAIFDAIADDKSVKSTVGIKDFAIVLKSRKLWGIYIGQFAVASTLWFFLTWFPTYLVEYRGLTFVKTGLLASLPFLAAFVGVLSSGFLSDFLVKKGVSDNVARKVPVITGLLLATSIIGANYVENTNLVIMFMCIAFFGNGFASITWVFVSLLAPKRLVGIAGGVFNFIGGTASIIIPIVIGFLAKGGNFAPALTFIACVTLIGALSYIFLVGKVERIQVKEEESLKGYESA